MFRWAFQNIRFVVLIGSPRSSGLPPSATCPREFDGGGRDKGALLNQRLRENTELCALGKQRLQDFVPNKLWATTAENLMQE